MSNFFKKLVARDKDLTEDQKITRKTIVSFFFFFLFYAVAIWLWKLLQRQPLDGGIRGGIPQPLRDGLDQNEKIFDGLVSDKHLVKQYPRSQAAKIPRVNGNVGLGDDFDSKEWTLNVAKADGSTLTVKLDDIRKLPKTEIVFNFKCIEGWSEISGWAGAKLSDFMEAYDLKAEAAMKYMGLSTPDEEYYVGLDMPSALHPQTILCYQMNGYNLLPNHGAPLRLIIPVKYGVKSLKRIGNMYFANERPPDYWAERGYDYFIGL